ncbi:MAG: ion transporter [Leptolyngbya sp. Prado105]|jgi:voltage-gated potassium channel|nr:ion transporter [Leptolyngbya sp. Prado105]
MIQLREKVAFYLEDIETPLGRAVTLFITALVLVSSGIFVTQTYQIPGAVREALSEIEDVILVVFVIEYCLRIWCAEKKLEFIFSLYSIVDLLSIAPFLIGANVGYLRLFRWFRILRLIRFIQGKTIFGYVSSEDSAIYARILFTILSIVFVYSGLIYQVEHSFNPLFKTFLDAVYFSISTISTAGLGDITPVSQTGRFLTILMVVTGLILVPWQLGDLIKRLVKTTGQIQTICSNCGLAFHDPDANFCKNCGTALKHRQYAKQ